MGCFGWLCKVCEHPILGFSYAGYNKFMDAIVLTKNGDRISGEYDGYGRLGGIDLMDWGRNFCMVHAECYTGQPYAELDAKRVGHDDTQATGYEEWKMEEAFGPPNLKEIPDDRTYACKKCYITWKAKWAGGRCIQGCEPGEDKYGNKWDVAETLFPDQRLAVCTNEECYRASAGAFKWDTFSERTTCPSPKCEQPLTFPTLLDAIAKSLD